MSPIIQAPDRQDQWAPSWLVTLHGASGDAGKRFSTLDQIVAGETYHGWLTESPSVERNFADVFWGQTEISEVTLKIANTRGQASHLYTTDLRNTSVTVSRYDRYSGTSIIEFTGVVSEQSRALGEVVIRAQAPDLAIFEQTVPRAKVTTGVFGNNAIDVGAFIKVSFGNTSKQQLLYVNDDTANDIYDYLVGPGVMAVTAVYRNGPNGTLATVLSSEYTLETTRYSGYTTLRFTQRQINFSDQFHDLYADVTGLQTERNFARAIQAVLSNTLWGLGLTVDTASFDAATAVLDNVGSLYCDGVLDEERQAQDVLRDLMMVRGMRLSLTASGAWALTADAEQSIARLALGDGTGVGQKNLIEATNRRRRSLEDAVARVIVRYKWDAIEGRYRLQQSNTVHAGFGHDLIIEHPFIDDDTTADKVVDYLANREIYGEELVDVRVSQEGRQLMEGDLVHLTYAPLGYTGEWMEVASVRKELDGIGATLRSWDSRIYVYTSGPPAEDAGLNKSSSALRDAPPGIRVSLAETVVGSSQGVGYAMIGVDTDDLELDWIRVGGTPNRDLDWGESNYSGSLGTAFVNKTSGAEGGDAIYHSGRLYVATRSVASDELVLLVYDGDGTLVSGPTVVYSAGVGRNFWLPRIAIAGSTIYWLWEDDYVSGGDTDFHIRYGQSTLTGGSPISSVAVDSKATSYASALAIGVDADGNAWAMYSRSATTAPWLARLNSSGTITIAASQPFGVPAAATNIYSLAVFPDSTQDIIDVWIRTNESSKNVIYYGRMRNSDGTVLISQTRIVAMTVLSNYAHVAKRPLTGDFYIACDDGTDLRVLRISAFSLGNTPTGDIGIIVAS